MLAAGKSPKLLVKDPGVDHFKRDLEAMIVALHRKSSIFDQAHRKNSVYARVSCCVKIPLMEVFFVGSCV